MRLKIALVLSACWLGCSTLEEGDIGDSEVLIGQDEDLATTSSQALAGNLPTGSTLKTTANLNLRTGASTSNTVRLVIPNGATVTTVATAPVNGFYNVKYNGTTGWSSGTYLKLVSEGGTTTPTGSLTDKTPAGAVQRAKSGVGASYWWGHGRWFPFQQGGSNAGSCSGSCPNCSHSGSTGADCSGYVAKLWQVPSSNTSLTTDSHPYSTLSFIGSSSHWRTVSRGSAAVADAFVYNSNGAGHMFLYEKGDGWGWMDAYEAKGCSYGILYNRRQASSAYKAIRHY